MDSSKLIGVLEELFELEPGEITAETTLEGVPGWDSITFIGLIARIDEDFGVSVSPSEMLASRNIGELAALVAMRQSRAAA